jgi:hypothetical protein
MRPSDLEPASAQVLDDSDRRTALQARDFRGPELRGLSHDGSSLQAVFVLAGLDLGAFECCGRGGGGLRRGRGSFRRRRRALSLFSAGEQPESDDASRGDA